MLIVVGVLGATLPNQALSKTGSQASSKPGFDDPIYVFSDTPKEKCEAVDQWIRSVFSENYPSEVKRMKFKGAGSEVGVRKLAEMHLLKQFGTILGQAYP